MAHSSTDKDQSDRFIEAARELGCGQEGEAADRALGHMLPPRKPGEPAPRIVETVKPKGSRRRTARSKSGLAHMGP